jgi:hypothetical protein
MSVIAATITDAHLIEGPQGSLSHTVTGPRKTYRVGISCGTMTAGDTAAIVTADVKLQNITKLGKTVTLRQTMGAGPGLTPGGTQAYALIATVDGTTMAFSVGGPTAAAAVADGTKVSMYVSIDEV